MGENASTMNSGTIFTALMTPFPNPYDDKIKTEPFLAASRGIIKFSEKLGKVFAAIRYDMIENISKMEAIYEKNKEINKYLEDFVNLDYNEGSIVALESLQWLKRELHFFVQFFHQILCLEEDDIAICMKLAYAEALEPHHGWMGTQLFSIMSRFAPTHEEFMNILAMNNATNRETVLKEMHEFSINLSRCVFHLADFFDDYYFEFTHHV